MILYNIYIYIYILCLSYSCNQISFSVFDFESSQNQHFHYIQFFFFFIFTNSAYSLPISRDTFKYNHYYFVTFGENVITCFIYFIRMFNLSKMTYFLRTTLVMQCCFSYYLLLLSCGSNKTPKCFNNFREPNELRSCKK